MEVAEGVNVSGRISAGSEMKRGTGRSGLLLMGFYKSEALSVCLSVCLF